MKKNKFSLFKEYKNSFKYIKNCKKEIWFIFGIFVFFCILGFFISPPEIISDQILKYVEELLKKSENFGFREMFGFIFFNNLKSSFFGLIFGLGFGIFSLFSSVSNGYFLGFVSSEVVSEKGFLILLNLLPHGIFELPAVFISLGAGLKLGSFFMKKDKLDFLKINLINSIKAFVLVILPLLVIAGIIESALIVF